MATKEDFYRKYNSLPLSMRNDVCCTYRGEPISWRLAKDYVDAGTGEGSEILRTLNALGLI